MKSKRSGILRAKAVAAKKSDKSSDKISVLKLKTKGKGALKDSKKAKRNLKKSRASKQKDPIAPKFANTKNVVSLIQETEIQNVSSKSLNAAESVPLKIVEAAPHKDIPQMTRNNHFEFGYDGIPFIERNCPEQTWWVNYGKCQRETLDWRSECIIAAKEIRKSTDKDIWICFSGGIDSEVAAESFRAAKIPFRAGIVRFKNDLNIHDISWAVIYCETRGIPYELFDIDIVKFFKDGEMDEIANLTRCVSPQFPSTMRLMELISKKGGFPILGSAECYLEKATDQWVMFEREKVASLYRYLIAKNIEAVPGFFQWNPEIMYSFLTDDLVTSLVANRVPYHQDSLTLKPAIYGRYWQLTPRKKYTGFEKIMKLDRIHRSALEKRHADSNQTALIDYHDLVGAIKFNSAAPVITAEKKISALDNLASLNILVPPGA